jgi:hypothetical protein
MSRKGQNSILFVATLGVYLGLVLAGATPQVAAQRAAMARSFDIQDEIEFTDDLDKKPDGDRAEITDPVGTDLPCFEELIAALGRLDEKVHFDTAIGSPSDPKNDAIAFGFPLKLDGQPLSIALNGSSLGSASALLASTSPSFKRFETDGAVAVRQKVIDAASLTANSVRHLIVTHLPRASIDSLLAMDVK